MFGRWQLRRNSWNSLGLRLSTLGGNLFAWARRNRVYLAAVVFQVLLFPFGHWFDTRVFFGTAGGVAGGLSPYTYYDLIDYYDSPSLVGVVPGIGYAPPWALFLASMYQVAYLPTQNPLVLNLAIKLPTIAANLLLARFVRFLLESNGVSASLASHVELLILFNPFLIYTSSLWNMYDTIVALLILVSLYLLWKSKPAEGGLAKPAVAGVAIGLSIGLKHLALPLLPLAVLWLLVQPGPVRLRVRAVLSFAAALGLTVFVLVFSPFYIFGWPFSNFVAAVGYQAVVTGGFTLYRFLPISLSDGSALALLGYLPAIAVTITYVALYRFPLKDFHDLTKFALIVLIVFMATRTWVSEQNMAVIFPLVVIPELMEGRGLKFVNRLWIVFFVYALWNTVPTQFPFLLYPNAFQATVAITTAPVIEPLREGVLFVCVIAWLVLGWGYVVKRT